MSLKRVNHKKKGGGGHANDTGFLDGVVGVLEQVQKSVQKNWLRFVKQKCERFLKVHL